MMSRNFYAHTNESTLSARELFKHRLRQDVAPPGRGGQKDFEPDGSWMQSKALEAHIQEWAAVIGQPRVEKLKNIVQGEWDEGENLVRVDKLGKFWAHMGFTDNRRNWLYPEEALFLMETSSLELVAEDGRTLSLQEAYEGLLGRDCSLEEFTVFSHLRRLGYVVLRHQSQDVITDYERKINLYKYMDKKSYKSRVNESKSAESVAGSSKEESDALNDGSTNIADSSNSSVNDVSDGSKASKDKTTKEKGKGKNKNINGKRQREENSEATSNESSEAKKHCPSDSSTNNHSSHNSNGSPTRNFYSDLWSELCLCKQKKSVSETDTDNKTLLTQTSWRGLETAFPDLGECGHGECVRLAMPAARLLPAGVQPVDEEKEEGEEEGWGELDLQQYRQKHPAVTLSRQQQREEEADQRLAEMKFSFQEWTVRRPAVAAGSWRALRAGEAQWRREHADATPACHLWRGDTQPLVRPQDAWSAGAILEKLSIIKTVNPADFKITKGQPKNLSLSFDVHLPDKSFKKTMPGKPDHRVIVNFSLGRPPGLGELASLRQADGVPVHWAVVDTGDVAFYVFDATQPIPKLL